MTINELRDLDIKKGSKDIAKYVSSLYDDSSKMFLKQHRDWYINERFVRGDHWVVFNKTLNKIQSLPVDDGQIRRTVNKIRAQIRGVKNFIKRNQPRWEVHPNGIEDTDLQDAKVSNKIIQNIYRTRQFTGKLTDVIVNGLKYSVGILEGGIIDKEGKQYLDFWVDDTFDVVFDPCATTVQDCRFIIKAVKKPVSYIKSKYDVKDVSADNKEAAESYKEMLENEKYSRGGSRTKDDLETSIIYEIMLKWFDNSVKQTKFKIITCTDTQVLDVKQPIYRRYPLFIYNPEKDSNSIYSDPWIKDLISLNKSLDKTVSKVETYIDRLLGGKYLIKQGVEVSSITDKGAEKIYYKGSTPPLQQNLQPLPSAPFTFIQSLERYIEEFGGMREASLGRIPSSLQSGKAIEALQAADASTVSEPVENLELFLEEVGEFCLEVISDYQMVSDEIIEQGQKIKYIGKVENPPSETTVIKPSKVKVVIVPEVAYTQEEKLNRVIRLAEAGIIDKQTVLKMHEISNISEILERVQKEKDEEFKQEMMKQKESHRTNGEAPDDTASLADQENMQMASGQSIPATPQALWAPEHTELHMAFIQENQDAYGQHKDLFDEHIQVEQEYQQ